MWEGGGVPHSTLTDKIAQLSSELASAQAKLISSLLDNQRLLKIISERGGSWNTSVGVAYRKTYGGGATGPWDGPSLTTTTKIGRASW